MVGASRTSVIHTAKFDRVDKKNAFTPKIANEPEDALTRLDDPDLLVGVLAFAGDQTTAGLEMPFPVSRR